MRHVMICAVLACGALWASACARTTAASERPGSVAYKACAERAQGVTVDLHYCAAEEVGRQDEALNLAYAGLMARLPAARKEDLRRTERAWLAYREGECAFAGELEGGGSLTPIIIDDCYIDLTRQRTDRLRASLASLAD